MNQQLIDIARAEIAQCQAEGLGEEDILWMTCGAVERYARNQGLLPRNTDSHLLGEGLSPELNAAVIFLVKQQLQK